MDGMDSMPVEEAQISARRCSGAEFLKGINPPRPVRLVGTICAIEAAHFTIITHDDAVSQPSLPLSYYSHPIVVQH